MHKKDTWRWRIKRQNGFLTCFRLSSTCIKAIGNGDLMVHFLKRGFWGTLSTVENFENGTTCRIFFQTVGGGGGVCGEWGGVETEV